MEKMLTEEGKLSPRTEEYLEAVLNMKIEGKTVHAVRLAERLSVSPPTVAGALRRLKKSGLISLTSRKEVELTELGKREALKIIRRHRLLELLLTEVLGIDWSECHEEACRLEHAISPLVESKLSERLGHPAYCPHGNPIPKGRIITLPEAIPLSSLTKGTRVKVIRISEEATLNLDLMRFFQRHGIFPGQTFMLKEVASYAGTITLEGEKGELPMGMDAASRVWVRPLV